MLRPVLSIYFHSGDWSQSDQALLHKFAQSALPFCLEAPGTSDRDLPHLQEIEISIISDEAIAEVHGQFLGDPTPTDVITFQHGEILISAGTAQERAAEFGHSPLEETLLYLIHGLLHLNGHTDHEEAESREMHRVQDRIWNEVLGRNNG